VALSSYGGTFIGQLDARRQRLVSFSAFSIRYLKNSFRAR